MAAVTLRRQIAIWCAAIFVAAAAVVLSGFGLRSSESGARGAESAVFDVFMGATPAYRAYYERAAGALEGWLEARGFSRTAEPNTSAWRGPVYVYRDGQAYDEWYRGTNGSPYTFFVRVHRPVKADTGLGAFVYWHARGPATHTAAVESAAAAFAGQLGRWWDQFESDHPLPTVGSRAADDRGH